MTKPMIHRVFVYGSLKRGYYNNHMLRDAHFAGEAATPACYSMVSGLFPVVLHEPLNGEPVAGELYHVDDDTLADLDSLESEGSMYNREVVPVMERGHLVEAFIYVGHPLWRGKHCPPAYTHKNAAGALDWHPRYVIRS